VAVAARVLLGAVFLVSGTLKMADRRWPETARRFGAPQWLVPMLAPLELVVGALLVTQLGRPWIPLLALGLLVIFTATAAVHVFRGDDVPCGCFGSTSVKPVGVETLARNALLCLLAVLASR
jgi:uncharacterized membrane protein YphA (DoxX/SURF4 family)